MEAEFALKQEQGQRQRQGEGGRVGPCVGAGPGSVGGVANRYLDDISSDLTQHDTGSGSGRRPPNQS